MPHPSAEDAALQGAPAPEAAGPQALAVLSTLSSFTAHELVSPLAGLQTALSALAGGSLDERSSRLVSRCQQLAQRMVDIANDLRVLGGAHRPALDAVPVGGLIEGLFHLLVPPDGYRVCLELGSPQAPVVVLANARLISLALGNLVRNALDALPQGGSLGARLDEADGMVGITVWDEGGGVPPERRALLFREPFTSKENGTGLGLLLVRAVVEQVHGGRLSFEPNEPRGSRFRVSLPAARGE